MIYLVIINKEMMQHTQWLSNTSKAKQSNDKQPPPTLQLYFSMMMKVLYRLLYLNIILNY